MNVPERYEGKLHCIKCVDLATYHHEGLAYCSICIGQVALKKWIKGELIEAPTELEVLLSDPKISPYRMTLLRTLIEDYPNLVPMSKIIREIYASDPHGGPERPHNVVSMMISKLRKQIQPYGWTITPSASGRRGTGRYKLERYENADNK